jgi:hypothetical protein
MSDEQNASMVPGFFDDMQKDQPDIGTVLPFGSLYMGQRRGAEAGRPMEGAARGFLGGMVGRSAGAVAGAGLGSLVGPAGQHAGALLGHLAGDVYGTHLATRGLLNEKEAAYVAGVEAAVDTFKAAGLAADIGRKAVGYAAAKPQGFLKAMGTATHGVVGAGLGAGVGALAAGEGNRMSGALGGAAVGGGLGAGVGHHVGTLAGQQPGAVRSIRRAAVDTLRNR